MTNGHMTCITLHRVRQRVNPDGRPPAHPHHNSPASQGAGSAWAVAAEKASAASAPVSAREMVVWAEWLVTDFADGRRWCGCRASLIGIVTRVRRDEFSSGLLLHPVLAVLLSWVSGVCTALRSGGLSTMAVSVVSDCSQLVAIAISRSAVRARRAL